MKKFILGILNDFRNIKKYDEVLYYLLIAASIITFIGIIFIIEGIIFLWRNL